MAINFICDICGIVAPASHSSGKILKPYGWIEFTESVHLLPYHYCESCKYSLDQSNTLKDE
jgi:hypothetical protein